MAGETFSAVSSFALPKALTWAGLRAGMGAAILTSVYGPFGFRSQMRYKTLDASSGKRGTLSMSGVREVADIGEITSLQEGIGREVSMRHSGFSCSGRAKLRRTAGLNEKADPLKTLLWFYRMFIWSPDRNGLKQEVDAYGFFVLTLLKLPDRLRFIEMSNECSVFYFAARCFFRIFVRDPSTVPLLPPTRNRPQPNDQWGYLWRRIVVTSLSETGAYHFKLVLKPGHQ